MSTRWRSILLTSALLLWMGAAPTLAHPAPKAAQGPASVPPQKPSPPARTLPAPPSGTPPLVTDGARWYVDVQGVYTANTISLTAQRRGIAFDDQIGLRTDRETYGSKFVTPTGGSLVDGVTSNSFKIDRGGAASGNVLFGFSIPAGKAANLTLEANAYLRGGAASIGRNWGATQPYGHFVEGSTNRSYAPPSFLPQFFRAVYRHEDGDMKWMGSVGDFIPVMWNSSNGVKERNFVDLSQLTFRQPEINPTELAVSTAFAPDRTITDGRLPMRGADFWMSLGEWELETLTGRAETHPASPFDGWVYRAATGGRLGYSKPTWGIGFSAFHEYGDNFAVAGDPNSRRVPGGTQNLWSMDASLRLLRNLYGYGALASTDFHRSGAFAQKNRAVVAGLLWSEFLTSKGELRLQVQSVDPNYDALAVRNRTAYPANYDALTLDLRHPWKGGQAFFSIRDFQQRQPDIATGSTSFAVTDDLFPASTRNRGRANLLDWLAAVDLDLGKAFHLYLSWEDARFTRGATPGLAFSACHRLVSQKMAMLRYKPIDDVSLDVGLIHFASNGTMGTFARDVQFRETQVVPRLGVTWAPDPDRQVRFLLRRYKFTDGVAQSAGLNNFDASQVLLEVQSRFGGRF